MTAIQKAREALVAAREWLEGWASAEKQLTKIDAALAALDAETEVKVRELEWSGQSWGYIGPLYESETMLGTYTVEEYGAGNWCTYFNRAKFGDTHATEEAAKAAAQADFERRIRSALVTPEARS